jgi:VanZ family protein
LSTNKEASALRASGREGFGTAGRPHRSTAWPLALMLAALVLYASLYPFVGWRWPQGMVGADWLLLPWPKGRLRFDELSNFLGYVPIGALLVIAVLRSGGGRGLALAAALGLSAALSYSVELAQQFLPPRVPSAKDCLFNLGGALAGAALAVAIHAAGTLDHWHAIRLRWFERDSAWAFVLLLLWPVALLFPAPAPLALGHIWGEVHDWLQTLLADTPWADDAALWFRAAAETGRPLTRLQELLISGLGLLAPCLVAYATTRAGWHRLLLVAGAAVLAVGMMTMSTALNFGPEHAWAWWSPHTGPSLLVGAVLAAALAGVAPRWAAALGVLALALFVALVGQAPNDPYFAASLAGWEQGRLVRFHGLAQWVGWLWPYGAMAWLLMRLVRPAKA